MNLFSKIFLAVRRKAKPKLAARVMDAEAERKEARLELDKAIQELSAVRARKIRHEPF